jgi:hypothetical protein
MRRIGRIRSPTDASSDRWSRVQRAPCDLYDDTPHGSSHRPPRPEIPALPPRSCRKPSSRSGTRAEQFDPSRGSLIAWLSRSPGTGPSTTFSAAPAVASVGALWSIAVRVADGQVVDGLAREIRRARRGGGTRTRTRDGALVQGDTRGDRRRSGGSRVAGANGRPPCLSGRTHPIGDRGTTRLADRHGEDPDEAGVPSAARAADRPSSSAPIIAGTPGGDDA